MVMNFDDMGVPEGYKTVKAARARFRTKNDINVLISCQVDDDQDTLDAYPSSIENFSADVWDTGTWDNAVWDGGAGPAYSYTTEWVSINRSGFSHAMTMQQTFGIAATPFSELVSIAVLVEYGSAVN